MSRSLVREAMDGINVRLDDSHPVTIRVPDDVHVALSRATQQGTISTSDVIRDLLDDYLETHGYDTNPGYRLSHLRHSARRSQHNLREHMRNIIQTGLAKRGYLRGR